MSLKLSIVTADQTVLSREDVQRLVVPGEDGQLTLLPNHAALMTSLSAGTITAHTEEGLIPISITGGFLQILQNDVKVLADSILQTNTSDAPSTE
tara:strand:- start:10171 stop:10455 length:285 start_codon:yes stop_codon:yes gene_type:complete